MKISYDWLNDYIEITKTPTELANDLSSLGFTVESIEKKDQDFILDLEIHPNRGDCLSVLGIARELSALYDISLKTEKLDIQISEDKIDKNIKVTVSDPKICPRFTARIIDNIEIKPSPLWMQKRLINFGFRPINNIVDITNYVMVAIGQPLHAFDFNKIQDGQMNIHLTGETEELTTLDGKSRQLPKDTIVIGDGQKIYDLAGIMGGFASEVDEKTKTIILQSAIFDNVLIRRASNKLSHVTDASYRYERGVDYNGTTLGVNMAAILIKEFCPQVQTSEIIDIKSDVLKQRNISIDQAKINTLLGSDLSFSQMQAYLKRLNFNLQSIKKPEVTVPSYRYFDIKIWQDLAEEIARLYGYDKINEDFLPNNQKEILNSNWQKKEQVKDLLRIIGFTEIYSLSLVSKKQIELLGLDSSIALEITNPLSSEMQYFRPSLIPAMLMTVARNPWAPEIAIFEIGKVFHDQKEVWQVGLITATNTSYLIKNALEKLSLTKEILNIDQKVLDYYKIRRAIKATTFLLDEINVSHERIDNTILNNKYHEISKYPPTVRDLAFVIDNNIKAESVSQTITEISPSILFVEMFDEFESDKFGPNKKNLAFHVWLRNLKGPVSEDETNIILKDIIKTIEEKYPAKLRR